MRFVLPILFVLSLVLTRAELVPATRLGDWRRGVTVGVPGGIPARTAGSGATIVNLTNLVDNTGVTNASTVINNAITAAASNSVILLPAGTIRLNGGISLQKSGITIRGAGISNTIIKPYTPSGGINFGSNPDVWTYPGYLPNGTNRIANALKGASNIVITSGFVPDSTWLNKLVKIAHSNDFNYPIIATGGYDNLRRQLSKVTAVIGTNLTIWPPLVGDYTNAPIVGLGNTIFQFSGIEDLSIVATNTTSQNSGIALNQGYGCWIKNVKFVRCRNYVLLVAYTVLSEIRGCWIDRSEVDGYPGPNHSGIIIGEGNGMWVEDNISYDNFPSFEINCAVNSVFSYNFIASSFWGGMLNVNHTGQSQYNLYEGNVSVNMQSDGYYAGEGPSTYVRNLFYLTYHAPGFAHHGKATGGYGVALNRFTRDSSFVGNIVGNSVSNLTYRGHLMFGKPNMGNDIFIGYGPPWNIREKNGGSVTVTSSGTTVTASAPFFASTNVGYGLMDFATLQGGWFRGTITGFTDSTHVTLSSAWNQATPAAFRISPESTAVGFLEIDTNVVGTTVWKGNYVFPQGSPQDPSSYNAIANPDPTTFGQALGGDTVWSSLLYSNTPPAWWPAGLSTWPPIATNNLPTAGGGLPENNIRNWAQARFYGVDVSGGAGSAPMITDEPDDDTINYAATETLSVSATGTDPLTYQWYLGSSGDTTSPIGGATSSSYTTPSLTTTPHTYWVRVSNAHGTDDSVTATITVLPDSTPPAITDEPDSDTIAYAATDTLSVTATGTAPLTYQWYRGSSGDTSDPISGATSSSYGTPALLTTAVYWVRVSNGGGSADSATATITVIVSITDEPDNDSIVYGGTESLSVSAGGSPTLTYQWYLGTAGTTTAPISGATSSSYTTPVLTNTPHLYWVRVANAYGTDDSRTATITVTAPAAPSAKPPRGRRK